MCLVASYSRGAYNSLLLKITNSFNSKTCVKWSLSKDLKLVFKTNYCLMQVKSIAECSLAILQYFRPSLCYHLSLRSLFCLFLSGRFTQVLLYIIFNNYLDAHEKMVLSFA